MDNTIIKIAAMVIILTAVFSLLRQESIPPIWQEIPQETDWVLTELFVEKGIHINNESSLNDLLTREYSLSEMDLFFRNDSDGGLSLDSVESFCPVEVLRENDSIFYTVYKVKEGGYWYLFWGTIFNYDPISFETIPKCPFVASTIYLKDIKDASTFNALNIGQSTSKEVFEIDPYLEWDPFGSYATYSYSILNKDLMAVVQYVDEGAPKKEEHVIELVFFVHRTDWDCFSARIMNCDLPF